MVDFYCHSHSLWHILLPSSSYDIFPNDDDNVDEDGDDGDDDDGGDDGDDDFIE